MKPQSSQTSLAKKVSCCQQLVNAKQGGTLCSRHLSRSSPSGIFFENEGDAFALDKGLKGVGKRFSDARMPETPALVDMHTAHPSLVAAARRKQERCPCLPA